LLDDIETHAAQLPEDPNLNKLKKSAADFAKAVRESTVIEEMAAGEAGLQQFSGTLAHQSASLAADLMEQFLAKQCKIMGDQAGTCLKFQPKLASELGMTIEQLLEAAGLGNKPGRGMGSSGGYSMRRSSLRNVGLYGHTPIESRASSASGGKARQGSATPGNGGTPGNPSLVNAHGIQRAAGASDAAIPQQYRRQVGDYFQRVADEVDPACQACHTTGYALPGGFVSASHPVQVNVGCENCHGPSQDHVEDPKIRTPYHALDQCLRCHDDENSPGFDRAVSWPKVVHGTPKRRTSKVAP
jgi:hypothetical protein